MADTEETRAVLRQYATSWQAGDIPALLDAYADDAVFHYYGESDIAGTHKGKDASVTAMLTASTRAPRELLEVVDVIAGDRLGAIIVRERLTRGDDSADLQRVFLYRVDGGKITECWVYDENQRLVDALWAP